MSVLGTAWRGLRGRGNPVPGGRAAPGLGPVRWASGRGREGRAGQHRAGMRREVPGGPSAKAGPGRRGGAAGRWRGPRGRWEWEETGAPWGEPDGCWEEAEAAGETPRRGRGGEEGSAGRAEGAAPEAGVCRLHLEPCPVLEAMAWHLFPAGAGSPHLGLSGPREAAPGQSSQRGSDPQAAPVPSHTD